MSHTDKYKQLVHGAGEVLKSHEMGRLPHVQSHWASMEWHTHGKQEIKAEAELCSEEKAIRLYPSIIECPYGGQTVLREFGLFLLRQAGDAARNIWRNKLGVPDPGQIASFQQKLESPTQRTQAKSYRDLIDSYSTAFDRWVALNLTNALHYHNVPYSDSAGVNIYKWGPTCEYANGKRYHSLVPLTSVYASREQNTNFGTAFSDLLTEDLGSVREKSVAEQMRKLIRKIVDLAL